MKKLSQKAFDKLSLMRARAKMGGKTGGKGRRRSTRRAGGFGRIAGQAEIGSVIAGGGVALLGGLVLQRFFTGLPQWLSPAGVALWLWGWWRGIPMFRWAGLFLIALAVASWLGVTNALTTGVNNALSRIGGIGGGAGVPTTPGTQGSIAPSSDVQQAAADLGAALNVYSQAQAAFA